MLILPENFNHSILLVSIKADTDNAKKAISNLIPRLATAKTEISILIIDHGLLELLLNWDNSASVEVSDLNDDDDWITKHR